MKRFLAIFMGGFALLLAGCSTFNATPDTPSNTSRTQQAVYKGILPCADCPGIAYTLTLYRDQSGAPGRYKLTREYLDSGEQATSVQTGQWAIRSSAKLDGKVFVIGTDSPDNRLLFLRKTDNALEMLKRDGSRAETDLDYTLNKQH